MPPESRKRFKAALALLEAGESEALIFTKVDRASRCTEDFARLIRLSKEQDWRLIVTEMGIETRTSMGKAMAHMAGWLLAILLAAVGVPVAPAAAEPEPVRITDVTFIGAGGVILHGIVVAPRPSGKRRPALVMLEGAGNRGRQELQPAAEAFARPLIYDKRKVDYSILRRDYNLLADDAVAAVALLATLRDVDPSRLGLWAQSEGAYVAPLACRQSSAVKFVIAVGAVGVTPAVQTAWGYDQFLRHAGGGAGLPYTLEITALRTMILVAAGTAALGWVGYWGLLEP